MNNTTITLSFLVLILGSFGITQAYAEDTDPPQITVDITQRFEATGLLTPLDSLDGFGDVQVTDDVDPNPVLTHDAPDAFPVGQTMITWTATDSSGNTVTSNQYITLYDNTPPVFTLLGDSTITITIGDGYHDPGATAIDNIDGDLSSRIWKTFDSRFNTFFPGKWVETYTVKDLSGNAATPLTRTVIAIHDTVAPILTLIGPNPYTVPLNTPYVDPGSTCIDTRKTLPIHKVDTRDVDTKVPGTYSVEYSCYDAQGNKALESSRTVIVLPSEITLPDSDGDGVPNGNDLCPDTSANQTVDENGCSVTQLPDTTAPVITLIGQSSVTYELSTTYSDQGATCTDDRDSNPTLSTDMGNVDFNALAVSSIFYDCVDEAGNKAGTVTRSISIVDTTAPVLSLVGDNPQIITVGESYSEFGATCVDAVDGNLDARIIITGELDTSKLGESTINYNCKDSSQNVVQDIRIVSVIALPDPDPTPEPNDSEKIIADLEKTIVDLKLENDKLKQLIGSLEDQIDAIMVEFADSVINLNNWFRIQLDLYKQFP